MLLSSYDHSFIVQATVIKFKIYYLIVITIVIYNRKTLIVQATGLMEKCHMQTLR
jgi:hypothetical protein